MFISNSYASFHLWRKEKLIKHQIVPKCYENDWRCFQKSYNYDTNISDFQKQKLRIIKCRDHKKLDSSTFRNELIIELVKRYLWTQLCKCYHKPQNKYLSILKIWKNIYQIGKGNTENRLRRTTKIYQKRFYNNVNVKPIADKLFLKTVKTSPRDKTLKMRKSR